MVDEIAPTETVEHGEDDIVERWDAAVEAYQGQHVGDRWDFVKIGNLMADEIRRLRSQEPVGWQSWHTCPRDGRKVLAHFKDGWAETVCRDDASWWFAHDGDRLDQEPTHWRPFVGPPVGDEQ